ncbi:MAG: hypothetical protein ACLP1D_01520 [Xanthobacteraceae bacterium]
MKSAQRSRAGAHLPLVKAHAEPGHQRLEPRLDVVEDDHRRAVRLPQKRCDVGGDGGYGWLRLGGYAIVGRQTTGAAGNELG